MQKDKLHIALDQFFPLGLDQLGESNLQDRIDTKYVLPNELLIPLLNKLGPDYYILEVNGARKSPYSSQYFDTEKFDFYQMHMRGFNKRHKLRIRNYVQSGIYFFELKQKEKGRTIKTRISTGGFGQTLAGDHHAFYRREIQNPLGSIAATLFTNYKRITLIAKDGKERITLDLDLHFVNGEQIRRVEGHYIAELKQETLNRNSIFYQWMRKQGIRPMKFSKYCVGTALLYPQVKQNKLKRHIQQILTH